MDKNPGFTKVNTPKSFEDQLDVKNPMEVALIKRRKSMAEKKGLVNQDIDDFGKPVDPISEEESIS